MKQSIVEILGCTMAEATQVMLYLFGQITHNQCVSYFQDRPTGRNTIDAARASGYIMINCKLYAYHYWYYGAAKANAFNICRPDLRLLQNLQLEFTHCVKPFTLQRHEIIMERLFSSPKLFNWMNRLIYKKMSFLIKSYGYKVEDIQSHLIEKALYALMKQYPSFHSPLHFLNTAKTTIRNTAQTFITANTRQKNQRLIRNDDGSFESAMAPIDSIAETDIVSECEQELKDVMTSLVQLSVRFSPDVCEFIQTMGGQYNPDFSRHIGKDNRDAIETMQYETYRKRLEVYMGVTREQTDRIFSKIQQHL